MQINPLRLSDAIQIGDSVYELILTNWGNRGLAQDPNNGSVQFPPVKSEGFNNEIPITGGQQGAPDIPSLSAIAISPRSDLDRCVVRTATPQLLPTLGVLGFRNSGGILETEQVLAYASPLIGQMPGPVVVQAHVAHWFSDAYLEDGNTATSPPFGTNPNVGNPGAGATGGPIFINPELRVFLYLNQHNVSPPTERAPFHHAYSRGFGVPLEQPAIGERLTKIAPVMGRRRIRVGIWFGGPPASSLSVRMTGTFTPQPTGVNPAVAITQPFEVPLIGPTVIAAGSAAEFTIDNPAVSYLLVKVTPSVNGSSMVAVIEARD